VQRLPIHRYRFNLCARKAIEAARGADLIHAFGFHACLPALAAARKLSIPVLWTASALFGSAWREMKPGVAGHIWEQIERWLVRRRFDGLHLISESSYALAMSMGADPARSFVITVGIRHQDFTPHWPKDRTVLFSGKLDVRKGIFDFLEAAARLPHIPFEVVGWGHGEAEVRARATANVTIHPFLRGAALRAHFCRAAIFCMPSHVEPFGLALIEAMASGCAIVSSVPLPFAGISIPPRDVDAIVRAVEQLWSDPVRTEQEGRENIALVRRYDWDEYAGRLLAHYTRMVDSYQPLRGFQPMEMSL
jgi:glycosyltransferase involved in cell wall biosynthesis